MFPRLRTDDGPSPVELRLKDMINTMPGLQVHPHSPSGPASIAVMFHDGYLIMGNAHQTTPNSDDGWTARAFIIGKSDTLREGTTDRFEGLPDLIQGLVTQVKKIST